MAGKHKLSDAQNIAANPRENVWVQANAGTGKTFVLVLRLLRILFNSHDVDAGGILCLTYTKAGASEMRNRILARLREWAMETDDKLRELLADVSDSPEITDDDISRARAIFFRYIDNPDVLKIKTIHSFCEEILRRFPIEAGISPSWSLVSDADERALQYDAFVRMVNDTANERVADAFLHLVGVLSEYSLPDVPSVLTKLYKTFYQVDDFDNYRKYFVETTHKLLGIDTVLPTLNPEKCLAFARAELQTCKKPTNALIEFINVAQQFVDKTIDFEKYKELFLNADGAPSDSNRKLAGTREYLADEKDAVYKINLYANIHKSLFDDTVALFDLAAAYAQSYRDIKRRHNLLDFEDLILCTHRLFSNPTVMGWVLSQLDISLKHILVDEAQDTSPIQWELMRMLAGEFFVSGDTDDMPHSIFVVGDSKQSIFSFQGADPRAFATSRAEITAQLRNNARDIRPPIALDKSFRSLPAILNAVDAFFFDADVARDTAFENNRHYCHRTTPTGLVEIHRLLTGETDNMKQADYIRTIAQKIHGVLQSCLGDAFRARVLAANCGRYVDFTARTIKLCTVYTPRDIMVLVRSRGAKVDKLIKELKRLHIGVAGNDRIWLPDFPAVRDLMNVVRFCLDTTDDYSLCCVLKSPLFRLKEGDIYELCKIKNSRNDHANSTTPDAQKTTVFDVLAEQNPDIHARLLTMIDWAKTKGPYSFFSELLNAGARTEMISALGNQIVDPLEEFMTLCLSYERTQTGTLHHFIKWFITGGSQVKRDMEAASGVRIVTIHGSKGLEAPVIFLIDTVGLPSDNKMAQKTIVPVPGHNTWLWSPRKPNSPVYLDADAAYNATQTEEHYRLLYVAMTRARDRLYIYGHAAKNNINKMTWYARLWDVLSRADGAIVTDDTIRIGHE